MPHTATHKQHQDHEHSKHHNHEYGKRQDHGYGKDNFDQPEQQEQLNASYCHTHTTSGS